MQKLGKLLSHTVQSTIKQLDIETGKAGIYCLIVHSQLMFRLKIVSNCQKCVEWSHFLFNRLVTLHVRIRMIVYVRTVKVFATIVNNITLRPRKEQQFAKIVRQIVIQSDTNVYDCCN